MRSLRLTAVLSAAAWLCLSGTKSRAVDAPPPQTGTHQHNSFAGMDGLITTILDGYKNLRSRAQRGIAVKLKDDLADRYRSHHFATVVYDFSEVNKEYNLLSPGLSHRTEEGWNARSGAITGPAGCDQAGVDPPWHTCWEGGSLLRFFAGSRAVDAQGLPTFVRTAVVFWWPVEEFTHEQGTVAEAIYAFDQSLKSEWWDDLREKDHAVWRGCTGGNPVPLDATKLASCFAQAYAAYAAKHLMTRPRGFLVAPAQAKYDFSSGHIFKYDTRIIPAVPEGPVRDRYGKKVQINLLFAALF